MPIIQRFFVPKFVDIEPELFELSEDVTGVRFFRHSVITFLATLRGCQAIDKVGRFCLPIKSSDFCNLQSAVVYS